MATLQNLRARVQRLAYSSLPFLRPFRDALKSGITSGTTVFGVTNEDDWDAGDILVFQDNGEECVVVSVTSDNTNQITVRRGAYGTIPTSHPAASEFEKNPRFTIREIDDAIEVTIQDLWPQVFKLATGSFTFSPNTYWYPISDSDCLEVLTLYYEDPTYVSPRPLNSWFFRRELDAAEFVEPQGIFLPSGQGINDGQTVFYTYKKRISDPSELLTRQERIVILGAVAHLLAAEDVARSYDPGRMTDRTVQPGQNIRDSVWYLRTYALAKRQEELLLKTQIERIPTSRHAERIRRWRP
jgi:hypothetical protein